MTIQERLDFETDKYVSLQACVTDVLARLEDLRKLEELGEIKGRQIEKKAVLEAGLVMLKEMGRSIGDNIFRLRQRGGFYHYE